MCTPSLLKKCEYVIEVNASREHVAEWIGVWGSIPAAGDM